MNHWMFSFCFLTVTLTLFKKIRCSMIQCYMYYSTVKPVLRDHCHNRPPVLKDHIFLAEGLAFQCNWTCQQRPPALRDHIFMASRVSVTTGSTVTLWQVDLALIPYNHDNTVTRGFCVNALLCLRCIILWIPYSVPGMVPQSFIQAGYTTVAGTRRKLHQ